RRMEGSRSHHASQGGSVKVAADERIHKPLGVSLRIGGESAENQAAIAAIHGVGRIADDVCEHIEHKVLHVELTFDVPGPITAPDYTGLRTGTYFRDHEFLIIQVAVPMPFPQDHAVDYMVGVLEQMLDLARGYVKRRR